MVQLYLIYHLHLLGALPNGKLEFRGKRFEGMMEVPNPHNPLWCSPSLGQVSSVPPLALHGYSEFSDSKASVG